MRVSMMLVFMVVSSSAWSDALKVKVKSKNNSHEHRHDKHDNRAEWNWRRPSWRLFYSSRSHQPHKRYSGNSRDHYHYSGNWGHGKQRLNWRSAGYSYRHYSGGRGHGDERINWRSVDQFQTRRSNKSEPVIYINAEVSAISLRGIKRHAEIYDAYAELGNGRRIPLRNLEGSLHAGESLTMHFRDSHYVTKVYLKVGPEYRHQRAYVSVDYLPANSRERGQ